MQRIRAKKLSDVIVERLESMILEGNFTAGQRLPSERELAEQFAVSRPSLREAIQKLEAKGLVYRKQGGGTFVKNQMSLLDQEPLLALMASRPESQFDLLEFRLALEGMAAYYAAARGTEQQKCELEQAYQEVKHAQQTSGGFAAEAKALACFYHQMLRSTNNMVMLHIFQGLQTLLEDNICRNLEVLSSVESVSEQINGLRFEILQAIVSGDPERARQASNEHLVFIEQTLLEINRQQSDIQRSLRRMNVPN